MKKSLQVAGIILIVAVFWRISQIIFDVFYSTNKSSYLGITNGSRVKTISSGGYEELHINSFTNSTPKPYKTNRFGKFQDSCKPDKGECKAFFGQDIFSSYLWMNIIQYIAREVEISLPSDITNRSATLHDLDPTRYYPYILTQLIGNPSSSLTSRQAEATIAWENVAKLGERGISYHCDMKRIESLDTLSYDRFIEELNNPNSLYHNICSQGGVLAHDLAFNYYYYLHNKEKSILYYKVASFHEDVPSITSSMPALIEGALGDHHTSAYLWYDKLQHALDQYNSPNTPQETIADIEGTIQKSLEKSVSEYSLYLLDHAQQQAQDNGKEECSTNISCLLQEDYISDHMKSILNTCTKNTIDCDILQKGLDNERITTDGLLVTPQGNGARYGRDDKKEKWKIVL